MNFVLLSLLVLALSGAFYNTQLKTRWRTQKWSKALQLEKHSATYEKLFKTVNGFELSRRSRALKDAPEYLYGEIDFFGFIALLSIEKPEKNTIFYDLGSGIGKAVIACMMVYDVQKSCGVELFSLLHQAAAQQQKILSTFDDYLNKASKIQFIEGDFLHIDFKEATYVFVNATAFVSVLWETLSQQIADSNAQVVISTSKPLKNTAFQVSRKLQIPMSWGPATVFIQKRANVSCLT